MPRGSQIAHTIQSEFIAPRMKLSVCLCALRGERFSPRPLRASLSDLSGQYLSAPFVTLCALCGHRSFVTSDSSVGTEQTRQKNYPAFFLTFVPIRNSFLTVPVGSRFIWSYNSVTASKNPAIATNRSRV